ELERLAFPHRTRGEVDDHHHLRREVDRADVLFARAHAADPVEAQLVLVGVLRAHDRLGLDLVDPVAFGRYAYVFAGHVERRAVAADHRLEALFVARRTG